MGVKTYPKATLRQLLDDVLHTRMICAKLHLAWKVEEHVVVLVQLVQSIFEPVVVGFEILHAVQHTAVGAKSKFVHHILEFDERSYIECTWIWDILVRGVEIDNSNRTIEGSKKLVFAVTVC